MDEFSHNGYLEENLLGLYDYLVEEKDKDLTVLVCGGPGNGKSALTWFCGQFFQANRGQVGFNWEDTAFTHEQWIQNEKDRLEKYGFSWYDEGYNTFHKRNAMANENKEGISHLNQYRFKHHVRFINFQDIKNIEQDLLFSEEIGVELLLRCVQQGWLHGYSQQTMQRIEIKKDRSGRTKVKWPDPDFRDGWPNPEKKFPEKWKQYEEMNEEKLKEDPDQNNGENGEDELSVKEMAKVVKNKQDRYKKEYKGRKYIDLDLIQADFEIGSRVGKKVKKLAEADLGLN